MTTAWTDINKASGTSYVDVPKPVGTTSTMSFTYSGGEAIGLLLALTYSSVIGQSSVVTSKWVDVSKATGTAWIDVAKAT